MEASEGAMTLDTRRVHVATIPYPERLEVDVAASTEKEVVAVPTKSVRPPRGIRSTCHGHFLVCPAFTPDAHGIVTNWKM